MDMRLLLLKEKKMSIRRQCELLGINRSSVYYTQKGENKDNLRAMHLMDQHILEEPTAGVLTMQSMLD
ncbi:hypothetical protein MG290_14545 (plasmid) [Flavobacterium sp. CBA20B-1]|uniref:hypothetical protein n=2 Tax=unclassified Flavobacterium TaxID=196869 RepID=UPI00234ACE4B|nr:hypothetical protein [Flavobacterium sp. CBA20B-1]WCM43540.1 hypothetical protein MG290_14545 [Flavobacterium sp. CBA20B-1]